MKQGEDCFYYYGYLTIKYALEGFISKGANHVGRRGEDMTAKYTIVGRKTRKQMIINKQKQVYTETPYSRWEK